MKKLIMSFVMVMAVAVAGTTYADPPKKDRVKIVNLKLKVDHNGKEICVSANAVRAHLAKHPLDTVIGKCGAGRR